MCGDADVVHAGFPEVGVERRAAVLAGIPAAELTIMKFLFGSEVKAGYRFIGKHQARVGKAEPDGGLGIAE